MSDSSAVGKIGRTQQSADRSGGRSALVGALAGPLLLCIRNFEPSPW